MDCDKYYRVWADVDLNAIRSNIEKIKKQLDQDTRICAVIKANAYGHGAVEVAKAVSDITDFFAFATMEEAIEVKNAGIDKPSLILGYVHPSYYKSAIEHDIRLTVFDIEDALKISEQALNTGKKAKVHIKVDTGMGRIGFLPDENSISQIKKICVLENIDAEGIFTHFAQADAPDTENARQQLLMFSSFISDMEHEGIRFRIRHCANSAAAQRMPDAQFDMVRLGVSMYGMYPSEYVTQPELSPSLSLKSHVIMVKKIPAGTCVGYGGTWSSQKESLIATVPAGYADGLHRTLSNKGCVLIKGHRFPIAGRICMDQVMIDVTSSADRGVDICRGDEVIFIGRSGDETLSAEEVAQTAGTINYEITCSIGSRVPRRYLF